MKKFLLLMALILSFAFDAKAAGNTSPPKDETSTVICKIIDYTHSLGGPMITIVIIGAALLAIFGRMPWPALFALGAFTAVFFGAPAVVKAIKPDAIVCK
ncbi:TrbC/VirB2 family protein [Wolbachia endosymbiont of Cantharis cryptica]|uniref:TrbC/VirB2 family protein n=1 Tax=Wolbachia endosymbiont of Cantharis cryptica TaxID=3066132 RepID=UPI00376EC980